GPRRFRIGGQRDAGAGADCRAEGSGDATRDDARDRSHGQHRAHGQHAAIGADRREAAAGAAEVSSTTTRPSYAEVAERQTHQLEGLAGATPWRFESSLPHQPVNATKEGAYWLVSSRCEAQRLVEFRRWRATAVQRFLRLYALALPLSSSGHLLLLA